MLPSVGPDSVKQRIAYGIVRVREPIIRCQKILPAGSRVAVGYRIRGGSQCAGGIGVLFPAQDIARGIVRPGPGFVQLLVILPGLC